MDMGVATMVVATVVETTDQESEACNRSGSMTV
jgi:hypothetical protein